MKIVQIPIESLNGRFGATNDGKIYYLDKLKRVPTHTTFHGYEGVGLYAGGKVKTYLVHRLIALCFIPNPENKPQVNHLDGNKLNNHTSNLEWCTNEENHKHNVTSGLIKHRKKSTGNLGRFYGDHPAAKPVCKIDLQTGKIIQKYSCIKEAGDLNDINPNMISRCYRGYSKQAGGFGWKRF